MPPLPCLMVEGPLERQPDHDPQTLTHNLPHLASHSTRKAHYIHIQGLTPRLWRPVSATTSSFADRGLVMNDISTSGGAQRLRSKLRHIEQVRRTKRSEVVEQMKTYWMCEYGMEVRGIAGID
jgi:hypothetical protein